MAIRTLNSHRIADTHGERSNCATFTPQSRLPMSHFFGEPSRFSLVLVPYPSISSCLPPPKKKDFVDLSPRTLSERRRSGGGTEMRIHPSSSMTIAAIVCFVRSGHLLQYNQHCGSSLNLLMPADSNSDTF